MSERTKLEQEIDALAAEGISCRVEGDHIVCTGDVIKTTQEEVKVPKIDFNAPAIRKLFEDKSQV